MPSAEDNANALLKIRQDDCVTPQESGQQLLASSKQSAARQISLLHASLCVCVFTEYRLYTCAVGWMLLAKAGWQMLMHCSMKGVPADCTAAVRTHLRP